MSKGACTWRMVRAPAPSAEHPDPGFPPTHTRGGSTGSLKSLGSCLPWARPGLGSHQLTSLLSKCVNTQADIYTCDKADMRMGEEAEETAASSGDGGVGEGCSEGQDHSPAC